MGQPINFDAQKLISNLQFFPFCRAVLHWYRGKRTSNPETFGYSKSFMAIGLKKTTEWVFFTVKG